MISLTFDGSDKSPILNPCFKIENWKTQTHAAIRVNGLEIPEGVDNRQGIIRDADGTQTLLIWLRMEETSPVKIEIV